MGAWTLFFSTLAVTVAGNRIPLRPCAFGVVMSVREIFEFATALAGHIDTLIRPGRGRADLVIAPGQCDCRRPNALANYRF